MSRVSIVKQMLAQDKISLALPLPERCQPLSRSLMMNGRRDMHPNCISKDQQAVEVVVAVCRMRVDYGGACVNLINRNIREKQLNGQD